MAKTWFTLFLSIFLSSFCNSQNFELGMGAVANTQWVLKSDIFLTPYLGFSKNNHQFQIGALIPASTPEDFAQFSGCYVKARSYLNQERSLLPFIGISSFFKNYRQSWQKDFVMSGVNYSYIYDGLFRNLSLNLSTGLIWKLTNALALDFDWNFGIEYYKSETIFTEVNLNERSSNSTGNIFSKSRPANLVSFSLKYSIAVND